MDRNLTLLLLSLVFGLSPAWTQQASRTAENIAAISEGADTAGRRLAITRALDAAHVEYKVENFTAQARSGANVVVTLSRKAPKTILIGAHYDRVGAGRGALDNAASCAVLLQLVTAFTAKPLDGFNLEFVFFDLEEAGLLGSRAYFEQLRSAGKPMPSYALNLDIFGYGDTIFATASIADGALVNALKNAGKDFGIPVTMMAPAEYPASDHRSMMAAGIESLGLSLLSATEVTEMTRSGARGTASRPRVLTIIHTANDTVDVIRPEDIDKAVPLLERALRLMS